MPDPGPPYDAPLPTVRTARLLLRPFIPADAEAVARNLSDGRIAQSTLTIPHPYPAGAAEEFIASHAPQWAAAKRATWAVTLLADGSLVGAIGLMLVRAHHRAEIGYWISTAAWGRGYATEATRSIIAFGFEALGLHRIEAHHFLENPASGRVMRNAGMRPEGVHRAAVWRDERPRDLASYAILATDPRG